MIVHKQQQKNSKARGFTLIEIMVSVAVFAIIMILGVGALVTVTNSYRISQQQKTAIDSLSFIMENMTRDIRTGTNYYSGSFSGSTDDSNSGSANDGTNVSLSFDASDDRGYFIYYRVESGGVGTLYRKRIKSGLSDQIEPLTSSADMNVTNLRFRVAGTDSAPSDTLQPSVWLDIEGELVEDSSRTFLLQTIVSQRKLDL